MEFGVKVLMVLGDAVDMILGVIVILIVGFELG
jgi:hypothetical protein